MGSKQKRCRIISSQIVDESDAVKTYRALADSFRKADVATAILIDKIADDEASHKKALTRVARVVCKK